MLLPALALVFSLNSPSVTLTLPATSVPRVFENLSRVTGSRIVASEIFRDEVLVIHLVDAPLDETLTHIAKVLVGKWTIAKDGARMLVADTVASRNQKAKADAEQRKILSNALDRLQKSVGAQPSELDQKAIFDYRQKLHAAQSRQEAAEVNHDYRAASLTSEVLKMSPGSRAVSRLVLSLGFNALNEMVNDQVLVWSENPTSVQRAMPESSSSILARYRRELGLLNPNLDSHRVKLQVTKWEVTNCFNVELINQDSSGKIVDRAGLSLRDDIAEKRYASSTWQQAKPNLGEAKLQVETDNLEVRVALTPISKNPHHEDFLQKWKSKLLDPVLFEPIQNHTCANLLALAKTLHKNLIVTATDLLDIDYWEDDMLPPSQFLRKHGETIDQAHSGWLVVKNNQAWERVSRTQGRNLINSAIIQGGLSLDDAAQWTAINPSRYPFLNWVGDYLRAMLTGGGPYSPLALLLNEQPLRLWSSLGPGTRSVLRQFGTVPLSNLNPEARQQVSENVYWFGGLDGEDIDPTDKLPNGVHEGTLTLTTHEIPVILGWSSREGQNHIKMPIDASHFGHALSKGSTYWEFPPEYYRSWDRFLVGVNRAYELHFLFQRGSIPMTIKLSETFFDPKKQPISRLPDEIQAQVDSARAEADSEKKPIQGKVVVPPT